MVHLIVFLKLAAGGCWNNIYFISGWFEPRLERTINSEA